MPARRKRRTARTGNIMLLNNDDMTRYAQRETARRLLRLLHLGCKPDEYFIRCMEWACGDLGPLFKVLSGEAKALAQKSRNGVDEDRQSMVQVLISQQRKGYALVNLIDELMDEFPELAPVFTREIRRCCDAAAMKEVSDPFRKVRRTMQNLFGMGKTACTLCEFIFLQDRFKPLEDYFEDELSLHKLVGNRLTAAVLKLDVSDMIGAVAELTDAGCLEESYDNGFELTEMISHLWENNGKVRGDEFFRPLRGHELNLEDFDIDPEIKEHLCGLLRRTDKDPVHLLFYGEPGSGKTSLARTLAAELKVKGFAVASRLNDNDDNRRCSLAACTHMASRIPGAFVLVDEAERLLETDTFLGQQPKDKAWLNDFLEHPGRKIIWITNKIGHIDQAVRRRFTYSVHFGRIDQNKRRSMWRRVLERHHVAARLDAGVVEDLAREFDVPIGVMNTAVVQSKALHREKKAFTGAIRLVLDAYMRLRNNGNPVPALPKKALYNPDAVSLREDVHGLLERCRRLDGRMKRAFSPEELPARCGNMLFSGPPGTGKTALARHIAEELGRQCLIRRACDLLGMYVGESEKQVAEAFAEAENTGAVLIIDEVDSFIYTREASQHTWETRLVNQFLTSLEEFRGFCICTTNRPGELDKAALRRFSSKVEFRYSGRDQVRALYATLLEPLVGSSLPEALTAELDALRRLTPGDFHAVRAQHWLDEPGELDHRDLLAELRREQEYKRLADARTMGF